MKVYVVKYSRESKDDPMFLVDVFKTHEAAQVAMKEDWWDIRHELDDNLDECDDAFLGESNASITVGEIKLVWEIVEKEIKE